MNTFKHEALAALVAGPGETIDWEALCALIPGLIRLEDTPQDPVHHAEGNVGIHTRMVLKALTEEPHYAAASAERRFIMFVAALLHDIAKPDTTVIDETTGRISQLGHSRRGAVDARVMLWRAGTPLEWREQVCRIIGVHQVPFFAFDSRTGQSPEFIVRKLSWELDLRELVAVARADMIGRRCQNQADHLADIDLFEELAKEEGAWGCPRPFADAHTAVSYFRGTVLHPEEPLFPRKGSEVTVMSGLPASGKDSWVARNRKGLPVVSFDDARLDLGLKHGDNDGAAAHHAVDLAKSLLREGKPFVWNATHLSVQMRSKTVDLLFAYGARVEIVHLEQSWEVIMQRNRRRDTSLTNAGIEKMLWRWEAPLPTEAHAVSYLTG